MKIDEFYKRKRINKIRGFLSEKGLTAFELLFVVGIIGILVGILIPNITKYKIVANEAGAKKSIQSLRDAELEYIEQDLDINGIRDYATDLSSLSTQGVELLDDTFNGSEATSDTSANCARPKTGYCFAFDSGYVSSKDDNFGWKASPSSVKVTGDNDLSVYSDGKIRCSVSTQNKGDEGKFEANAISGLCSW